jgi:serine/threonine protein kinase
MSPGEWERVKDVFEAALARQGADRTAYLAAACEGDESLRAEVERLLAGHDQAGSFLEQSPSLPVDSKAAEACGQEDLRIGQTLSHYQIAARLGQGGMGTVYRAMDLQLRRPVAIKVLRRRRLREMDPDRRFVQEARAASALNHPNICHVYEIGEADGIRFIAMEYIEGRTLEAAIRDGPLELSEIARIGAQTAEALAEAHAHGIIHRDIKPSNLMIGPRGELKILDFGIAKVNSDPEAGAAGFYKSSLTGPGILMGTVQYMSPEQLLGRDLDHRTDVFSLGLVLYEMATGRPAFRGTTPIETIDQILHASHEPLAPRPELERIVSKCLEKERERRYQSAGEVAVELREVGNGSPFKRKAAPWRFSSWLLLKRRRALVTAAAATAIIVLVLVAGMSRFGGSTARTGPVKARGPVSNGTTPQRWGDLKFEKIATLGDPAPGGSSFMKNFDPWGMNNRGDLAFVADVSIAREGVFLLRRGGGSALQLARGGQPAPGGGTFDKDIAGHTSINDSGDVAFVFELKPSHAPEVRGFAVEGLFRYSQTDRKLSAVVIPGVTRAPGFGVFLSTGMHPTLNNSGDIVFPGVVRTAPGVSRSHDVGQGIFVMDRNAGVTKVVAPGDPAPGGGKFDFAQNPWINDKGDVAFGAHVAGEECIAPSTLGCNESVYFKAAANGIVESIAHQDEQGPLATRYRYAWGPVLNNRGDIVFIGDLTPAPGLRGARGIFLYARGITTPIALPGDVMPDGRKIVTVNPAHIIGNYSLNNRGDVSFNASLENGESAFYIYSQGLLHLAAGTGTVMPGVGTISGVASLLINGGTLNDSGQIFFSATLTDGRGVLLLATPPPVAANSKR